VDRRVGDPGSTPAQDMCKTIPVTLSITVVTDSEYHLSTLKYDPLVSLYVSDHQQTGVPTSSRHSEEIPDIEVALEVTPVKPPALPPHGLTLKQAPWHSCVEESMNMQEDYRW
ncbi:hypothetical protein WMY93_028456, partial [Mugilogobius chulae]